MTGKVLNYIAKSVKAWPSDKVFIVSADQDGEIRFKGATLYDFYPDSPEEGITDGYLYFGAPEYTKTEWQSARAAAALGQKDADKCAYCGHPLSESDIHIEFGPFNRGDGMKITGKHEVVTCPQSNHKYHREIMPRQDNTYPETR